MVHLALLARQFSQHLIFRLRVRLSLMARLKSDPVRESLLPGIAMDEKMMMRRIIKMKRSKLRLKFLIGEGLGRAKGGGSIA